MTCIAIHSHLLFILLTTYMNMNFFILIAGKHSLSIMSINITNATLTQVYHEFQGLKLTISIILHSATTICIFSVILINNLDRFNAVLPSSVVVVILLFTFIFNVVGSLLLFSHKSSSAGQRSTPILGCAILSACASAFTFAVAAFFIRMPPRKTVLVDASLFGAHPPAADRGAFRMPPPAPPPEPSPPPPPPPPLPAVEPPAVESQRLD